MIKKTLPHERRALSRALVLTTLLSLTLPHGTAIAQGPPVLAPELTSITFEQDGTLTAEAALPPGFRYALLEVWSPGSSSTWEAMVAGPLNGASATATFNIPDPGPYAMLRVEAGDDPNVPNSAMSGPDHFIPTYGSGGTYISASSEPLQVLNRITFGSGQLDFDAIETLGTSAYIEQQLTPELIDESGNTELHSRVDDLFLDYLPNAGTPLVDIGADITYFKGMAEPPAGWTAILFDDSTWDTGNTGIGYGNNNDVTVLADMEDLYSSFYVRIDFEVAEVNAVEDLLLNIQFDDSFVAYLNGTEAVRFNVAGTPPLHTAFATRNGGYEISSDPRSFDLTSSKGLLENGTNTLAFQVHNVNISSSDASLVPQLVSVGPPAYTAMASIKDLQHLIHIRGVYSEKQLQAVLATFWENHFTTDYDKVQDYLEDRPAFEDLIDAGTPESVVRAQTQVEAATIEWEEYEFFYDNALGNFGDLLLYSATSPSMLIYLDSVLNLKNAPNENYSREILELSAFGVDNRYTQTDLEELARCFTGWSVRKIDPALRLPFPQSARTPFTTGSIAFASSTALISEGDSWKYFKGTAEPSGGGALTDWTTVSFDDSTWPAGLSGFGYGDDDDMSVLSDMRQVLPDVQGYPSVYVRKKFTLDPSTIDALRVEVRYDDGFVAYLNGVEVGRSRSMNSNGAPPTFNETSAGTHENDGEAAVIDLTPHLGLILPGVDANVLAIQGHNTSLGSSDFSLIPELFTAELTADSIPESDPEGVWTFWFNPAEHDLGEKTIFAPEPGAPPPSYEIVIPAITPGNEASGVNDAITVIDAMLDHPSTAEFICVKLVNRFVSDGISLNSYKDRSAPSWLLDIVDDGIAAWNSTTPRGNIKTVMTSILDPQLKLGGFWLEGAHLSKVKDPVEFINSSFRALGADIDSRNLPDRTEDLGMLLFQRDEPDGFSELGIHWTDTLGLLERMKFSQGLGDNLSHSRGNWDIDAFLLANGITTPDELITYFDNLLFANQLPAARRTVLLKFANTDDTGQDNQYSTLSTTQKTERLRELTGLILSAPEFQLQ